MDWLYVFYLFTSSFQMKKKVKYLLTFLQKLKFWKKIIEYVLVAIVPIDLKGDKWKSILITNKNNGNFKNGFNLLVHNFSKP